MMSFWHRLIDLISPRACCICGGRLSAEEDVICTVCNLHLPRTHFSTNAYDNIMARRFWGRIPVERAAALFYYEAGSEVSGMVHDLKYHDRPDIGYVMGRMAAEEMAGHDFFADIDLIIPIPLEKKRRRQRGYNQSEEIARGVAEVARRPVVTDAVERTDFKGSQTRKSLRERMENVEGAFRLTGKYDLTDKHLLVIDDIVTSGATVCACVEAMMASAHFKVSVLSLGVVK